MTARRKAEDWGGEKDIAAEGILAFFPPLPGPVRVLAIDSTRHLPQLRRRMPEAELFALTSFQDAVELPRMQGLGVHWTVGDFRCGPLPYEKESFDIVLAEPCLEFAYEPYDTFLAIHRLLRETGYVVSQFPNIRYCKVLEGLRAGAFPVQERRLFAKDEVVHLLSDALYQEISFVPLARDEAADTTAWEAFGFANYSGDLQTEAWMFRADRSRAEVAALKALYTKEIRAEMARMLHRVEYGIAVERQLAALRELCRREMIFPEYLRDFVHEAVFHEASVLRLLQEHGLLAADASVCAAEQREAQTEGEHGAGEQDEDDL